MKTDLKACLGLSLLCTIAGFGASPSRADEILVRSTQMTPSVIVSPSVIVTPESSVTTTTTRTIETTPTSSTVLVSPAADETISRRTVIVGERPAQSSSTTATLSSSLDNKPKYGERLRLLHQQLEKGIANGWINSDNATSLTNRWNDLQAQECTVRGAGYLRVDCDAFEKQLTGYNIDLSHSMESH